MSIYSESDRYMWVFCITYYLAETCLIRLKIVVNKNNNKKENRKGKIMDFIELLKVIFLGIVEGITEWLPISSTGHMILVDEFLKLNVTEDFKNLFFVVIQLGAILAVVVLYWNKLWPFYIRPISKKQQAVLNRHGAVSRGILTFVEKFCDKEKWVLWFKIIVACIPTIVIALPFNDVIEEKFNNYVVVAIALIVYGILFIVIENYNKRRRPTCTNLENLSFKTALIIGLFQVLSVVPGTSRSGSTIIGGILAGTSRTVAAEFTFFLFRFYHSWSHDPGLLPQCGCRVFLFPGNPGHVRSQSSENPEIRFLFHRNRGDDPDRGNGSGICSFHYRDQIPDGIHKET